MCSVEICKNVRGLPDCTGISAAADSPQLQMPLEKNLVSVYIKGLAVKALVDTGAAITCVSDHLLDKVGLSDHLQTPQISTIIGACGERHSVKGKTDLPVTVEGIIYPRSICTCLFPDCTIP